MPLDPFLLHFTDNRKKFNSVPLNFDQKSNYFFVSLESLSHIYGKFDLNYVFSIVAQRSTEKTFKLRN